MATKWISICDFCGKESIGGDEHAQTIFDIPRQPAGVSFFFQQKKEDGSRDRLDLELCAGCGTRLKAQLADVLPERFWNIEEDD